MAVTEFSTLAEGTRVRVRRGRYPMDASLPGREGTVVEHSQYFPTKVGVELDGEPAPYTFGPDELEVIAAPALLPKDKQEARKRLARP